MPKKHFKSVSILFSSIFQLFGNEKEKFFRFDHIDWGLIHGIKAVYDELNEAREALSGNEYPTLGAVVYVTDHLISFRALFS